MTDPIRAALERLIARLNETTDPNGPVPAWSDSFYAARQALEADGPVVPEGREPASVVGEPSSFQCEAWLENYHPTITPLFASPAALAQPEPAGDDGDVAIDRWIESRPDWPNNWPAVTQCQLNALIGEALEHWGRPARAALSADGPAVPEGGEPASVVNKPSDEDLWGLDQLEETWNAQADAFNNWNELGLDEIIVWAQRQALSRWGYHPAPPAEGEVGTLVSWLVGQAIRAADADQSKDAGMLTWAAQIIGERVDEDAITNKPTDEDLYDLAEVFNGDPVPAMRRALELWGRPAAPPASAPAAVPMAVSERLPDLSPSAGDFNTSGLLWWFTPRLGWRLGSRESIDCIPFPTHWLPFHALPVPTH